MAVPYYLKFGGCVVVQCHFEKEICCILAIKGLDKNVS